MNKTKGILFLAIAQSLIAFNIVSAKYSLQFISGNLYLTLRYLFAFMISFTCFCLSSKPKGIPPTSINYPMLILQAVTGGILFNIPMTQGLQYTDAAIAGIITSLLPIMTIFLSWLFFNNKLNSTHIIAFILSFIGLTLISMNKLEPNSKHHSLFGDTLIFLALIPEAFYYIISHRYPSEMSKFLNGSIIFGINTLLFIMIMLLKMDTLPNIPVNVLLLIGIQGLSLSIYYIFWLKGCEVASVSVVSLSSALMPIMTVMMAAVFLNEHLSSIQYVGIFIILATIIWQNQQSIPTSEY
jgi:drug/metabolite transporter (DMT)-like permease